MKGVILEFGVFEGTSINYFANKLPGHKIYGFDSFKGLKEDWNGTQHLAGMFDRKGKLPRVESNVILVDGWFDETLPSFIENNKDDFCFIHFDADTYKSTKFLLGQLANKIKANSILVFDEYIGFPGWRHGEYKAWQEFVKYSNIKYEYLAFSNQQVAIIVI